MTITETVKGCVENKQTNFHKMLSFHLSMEWLCNAIKGFIERMDF